MRNFKRITVILTSVIIALVAIQVIQSKLSSHQDGIKLPSANSRALGNFLELVKSGEIDKAYELTSPEFQSSTSKSDFKISTRESGLQSSDKVAWTGIFKESKDVTRITAKIFANKEVYTTSFTISDKSNPPKITAMSTDFTLDQLSKNFVNKGVNSIVEKDIALVNEVIEKEEFQRLHSSLSSSAQRNVSSERIDEIFSTFKEEGKDIKLPDNTVVHIEEGYPKINSEGIVTVQGSYPTTANKVEFSFSYIYEWGWKLHSIDIDTAE